MEELIRFVVNYEVGIYLVLGIVFFINLKRLVSAWISFRKANFGLEREVSQKGIRSAFTFIFLVSLFGLSNFILVSIASIRYPGIAQITTPTIDLLSTQMPYTGEGIDPNATPPGLQRTQTAIAITGCIPDQLEWIDPQTGDEIRGSIDLIGTVNLPNLGFYKYEYRYQGDDIWTPISAGNKPVVKEALGGGATWNTEQLQPGNYFLRLVVSDNANNLIRPCEIEVKVLPQ
ncbi:MAG: hypothetical protein J7K66_01900 [Anaerolineaceae bacterium]|nr:hypothetical protein [Anaerolineaceae bacterium]